MTTQQNVGIIGLGSMGYGMAKSVLAAGHITHGFDINSATAARFLAEGGAPGALNAVLGQLDALVVVVLNAAQTKAVLFGDEGGVRKMKAGSVVMACATVPPAFARDMAEQCAAYGVHYLDAPISGGAVKAAHGMLSVLASGCAAGFAAAQGILDAMAEKVFNLGDQAGAGSAMKAVNQLLAGVHIAAMAEAMTFGITQGVSPEKFVEVIPECAGTSWMLENRAPHIVAGDYTPHSSVNIWPKDLGIVLDIAQTAGFAAPVTQAALGQFMEAAARGLGGEDDAAVAKVYAGQAGVKLPGQS